MELRYTGPAKGLIARVMGKFPRRKERKETNAQKEELNQSNHRQIKKTSLWGGGMRKEEGSAAVHNGARGKNKNLGGVAFFGKG